MPHAGVKINDCGKKRGDLSTSWAQTAIDKLNRTRGGIIASAGFVFVL